MAIEIIKEKQLWNEFLDSSLNSTLFHRWDFLKIIEKHSGFKLLPYAIYIGDELIAQIPLFIGKKAFLNMVMSPPFSFVPYLGPVIKLEYKDFKQNKKELILNSIAEDISHEIQKISSDYIMINTTPDFFDIRPFKWEGYIVDPIYTYVINLDFSLDELWASFKKSCRKNIKNIEGKCSIRKSQDVSSLSKMIASRFEEQKINTPVGISFPYLEDITGIFKENLDIYYLYDEKDQNIITGLLNAKYNSRYIIWIGNARVDLQGGNEYLLWELIKIAKSEGYHEFEILGANTKNLCQFKSKFNPNLEIAFDISKKSFLGSIGEWCYFNFIKKRWS